MWSIFYLLVEFGKGSLPWSKLRDKVLLSLLLSPSCLLPLFLFLTSSPSLLLSPPSVLFFFSLVPPS
jgi:hypothetical protein